MSVYKYARPYNDAELSRMQADTIAKNNYAPTSPAYYWRSNTGSRYAPSAYQRKRMEAGDPKAIYDYVQRMRRYRVPDEKLPAEWLQIAEEYPEIARQQEEERRRIENEEFKAQQEERLKQVLQWRQPTVEDHIREATRLIMTDPYYQEQIPSLAGLSEQELTNIFTHQPELASQLVALDNRNVAAMSQATAARQAERNAATNTNPAAPAANNQAAQPYSQNAPVANQVPQQQQPASRPATNPAAPAANNQAQQQQQQHAFWNTNFHEEAGKQQEIIGYVDSRLEELDVAREEARQQGPGALALFDRNHQGEIVRLQQQKAQAQRDTVAINEYSNLKNAPEAVQRSAVEQKFITSATTPDWSSRKYERVYGGLSKDELIAKAKNDGHLYQWARDTGRLSFDDIYPGVLDSRSKQYGSTQQPNQAAPAPAATNYSANQAPQQYNQNAPVANNQVPQQQQPASRPATNPVAPAAQPAAPIKANNTVPSYRGKYSDADLYRMSQDNKQAFNDYLNTSGSMLLSGQPTSQSQYTQPATTPATRPATKPVAPAANPVAPAAKPATTPATQPAANPVAPVAKPATRREVR